MASGLNGNAFPYDDSYIMSTQQGQGDLWGGTANLPNTSITTMSDKIDKLAEIMPTKINELVEMVKSIKNSYSGQQSSASDPLLLDIGRLDTMIEAIQCDLADINGWVKGSRSWMESTDDSVKYLMKRDEERLRERELHMRFVNSNNKNKIG